MNALMHIKHPNVVRTYDIFRADQKLFIVMEFVPKTLASLLNERKAALSERVTQLWMGQVIAALAHVHMTNRMAHRDIKLDNVLLTADYRETKLADFGMAMPAWDKARHCVPLAHTHCGYMCPQLVAKEPYNPYSADAWAIGTMLFVMLHARFAFDYRHDSNEKQVYAHMMDHPAYIEAQIDRSLSKAAVEVIVKLLDPDEKSRLTLHEALANAWFATRVDVAAALSDVMSPQASK